MKYTDEQQSIIQHSSGHAIVNAVPGSGKTQCLVGRAKYLIDNGHDARKIMVIMFNKSAQRDFYRRLEVIINQSVLPEVRTFHSLAYRMLQRLIALELVEPFRLETNTHAYNAICRKTLQHFEVDDSNHAVETLQEIITVIKSNFTQQPEYNGKLSGKEIDWFNQFETFRHHQKIRFYDDLQYDLVQALSQNSDLIQLFHNRLTEIIVDEYQDINRCQQAIVKLLAGDKANVMVVGDVNQTIYEFRGSDPKIMLNEFKQDFVDPNYYNLSYTFRFGQTLSDMANHFIAYNNNRYPIDCHSFNSKSTTQINFITREVYQPAKLINHYINNNYCSLNKVAVLVRQYSHAIKTELDLLNHNIPYRIEGSEKILFNPIILSIMGYLKLADNAKALIDDTNENRLKIIDAIFQYPGMFIPRTTIKLLIDNLSSNPLDINLFQDVSDTIKNKHKKKLLNKREDIWNYALGISETDNAFLILKDLYYQLGYERYFDFTSIRKEDAEYKKACLNSFIDFTHLNRFNVGELLSWFNAQQLVSKDHIDNSVLITSMHRAKGLQWDCVIIPGLFDGNVPSKDIEDISLEAERRVFYVAITRARKQLYLIGDNDVTELEHYFNSNNKKLPTTRKSSPFIYECGNTLLQGNINDKQAVSTVF